MVIGTVLVGTLPVQAERIKDLASVRGVRSNQLIGYGIVIGLSGTGDSDKTTFTTQSIVAMLARNNVRVQNPGLKLRNAAVMVTTQIPAFSRIGNQIDVTVSSIGDALVGGTLVATPLKGHDGQIYAMAQGSLAVGGFSVGDRATGEVRNHPTVARISSGAIVEREVPHSMASGEKHYSAAQKFRFHYGCARCEGREHELGWSLRSGA